jgi:excisionase family DNA binding protein
MGDPQPLRDVLAGHRLLLTPEEAAKVLRVGRTTVYALMKSGVLRPVHIGRSCRISQAGSTATSPARGSPVPSTAIAGRRVSPQRACLPPGCSARLTLRKSAEG